MAGARDFTVHIAEALDGDIGGEDKFIDDPDEAKSPLKGATVSDAGVLRAPPDGDDPSRKRSIKDLSASRLVMKHDARYQLARAVAGHLARNVSDLLEKDHVIEEARSQKLVKPDAIRLSFDLWLPAKFSKEAIKRTMDSIDKSAYLNADKDKKDALLADACVKFVQEEIRKRYEGGVTPQNVKSYVDHLDHNIDNLLNGTLPSNVTATDLQDLIINLQYKMMAEIGRTRTIPSSYYENLQGGTDTLAPIIEDKISSSKEVPVLLDEWDKKYNNSKIKTRRDEVERINQSRSEYIPVGDWRNKDKVDESYPKGLAQLPETTHRIMFSPVLSSALSKALDSIRRAFNSSQEQFGTLDPVDFAHELCSESMKLVFTEIAACYIRLAELSTPRRPESIRDNLPAINIQLSQLFERVKQFFIRLHPSYPSYPRPFYCMRGEGSSERHAYSGLPDEGIIDDANLGIPLVNGGTKRQKGGRLKTGFERAEAIYNKRLLSKYAGV